MVPDTNFCAINILYFEDMKIKIRKFKKDDAKQVANLIVKTFNR
jgi:hypothetical protein